MAKAFTHHGPTPRDKRARAGPGGGIPGRAARSHSAAWAIGRGPPPPRRCSPSTTTYPWPDRYENA
eukprot:5351857-Alexandrium_andersonii.AAC.1